MTGAVEVEPVRRLAEVPLIGSMRAFQTDRLALLRRVADQCGDVGLFHFGPVPVYVFNRSDLVHQVLVTHADAFEKGPGTRKVFGPALGEGMFTAEGAAWRRQRKLIAPAFGPRQIAAYAATMTACTEQAVTGWDEGAAFNVTTAMRTLTMRIIGKLLFDAEAFDATDDLGAAILEAARWTEYAQAHLLPISITWPAAQSTPRVRRMRAALAVIEQRILAMIDARRLASERRDDLLSMLLWARDDDGSAMSDTQIRDEALTLFLAAHEPTANTLSWACYLLATHLNVYRRVQEEADSVLQGRTPTPADLPKLPYLLRVLKETLRLYPPTYLIPRTAIHDVEIEGLRIRRGQHVLLPIYTLHRHPDYYDDPDRFDPERWTPENERDLPRYAFMPFGAGARICLGNHFAMMEMQLLLATLAQRVTFLLVPGQQVVPAAGVNLTQRHGCRVRVHRRVVTPQSAAEPQPVAPARPAKETAA